jgi:hypothetical protein
MSTQRMQLATAIVDLPEHHLAPQLSHEQLSALAMSTALMIAKPGAGESVLPYTLWLVFCCPWGDRFMKVVVPFDDPADELCKHVAAMLDSPHEPDDIAIVVFQRDTADAKTDKKVFRLFREAAFRNRDAVPWLMYAAGPDSTRLLGTSSRRQLAAALAD